MLANSKLAALPPSGIRVVQYRMRPTSIDLSIGQPSLMPDPKPFVAAADWVRDHGYPYPPYNGIEELRAAVASINVDRLYNVANNV